MEASERAEERAEPRLPSVATAVELREALAEEDRWKAILLDPRRTTDELQAAAREVTSAHMRVKAARHGVMAEVGVLELPILTDDRPRFVP